MNDIEGPISFLTVEDVAEMLRLDVAAILALPVPRYVFSGGGTRFLLSDLLAFIKASRRPAPLTRRRIELSRRPGPDIRLVSEN